MERVLGITDGTTAELHALALAAINGGSIAANVAAGRLGVSPTYLAKVLQAMASKGIIVSTRGSGGGFSLKKPASELSCLEAIEALEGPLPSRYCLFEHAVCTKKTCAFRELCIDMEKQIRSTLSTTTIEDLARSFQDKE
ncbi:putative Transcriptional regulator, BadM/Rrf2 family [uncultured spirochete]|jgi:Rrf2 family iron-sulfur cluster assembly transcriptional regulator|uniref:Putative Transcriptional regulator, BadM/Rrf2 family n=1 Tax=uncultured spirochete TaxID=156406 RepID=A0A3P3XMB9_9SPIR|nr:putative Transcriptional regulator, BadM/Rrf2 family [uncultured spirochete]